MNTKNIILKVMFVSIVAIKTLTDVIIRQCAYSLLFPAALQLNESRIRSNPFPPAYTIVSLSDNNVPYIVSRCEKDAD